MREPVLAAMLAGWLLGLACPGAQAQGAPVQSGQAQVRSIDIATERARLTLPGRHPTWWTNRLQYNLRQAAGDGWFVAAESQKRERDTDLSLGAGMYGRSAGWWWSGQVAVSPGADFLPRYALEPQAGLQLGGALVQAGYIYRSFDAARVRIATFGLTTFRGDSELEFKLAHGTSQPFGRHIRVATVRGLLERGGAWSAGASASIGKGLYDILNVPGTSGNRGWSVAANVRYKFDGATSLRLDLGLGHEKPLFRERRIGLSLRRMF